MLPVVVAGTDGGAAAVVVVVVVAKTGNKSKRFCKVMMQSFPDYTHRG